jgi:hypothetical protein
MYKYKYMYVYICSHTHPVRLASMSAFVLVTTVERRDTRICAPAQLQKGRHVLWKNIAVVVYGCIESTQGRPLTESNEQAGSNETLDRQGILCKECDLNDDPTI